MCACACAYSCHTSLISHVCMCMSACCMCACACVHAACVHVAFMHAACACVHMFLHQHLQKAHRKSCQAVHACSTDQPIVLELIFGLHESHQSLCPSVRDLVANFANSYYVAQSQSANSATASAIACKLASLEVSVTCTSVASIAAAGAAAPALL